MSGQPPNKRLQLPGAERPGPRPVLSADGGQRTVEFGIACTSPAAEPRGVRWQPMTVSTLGIPRQEWLP